MDEDVGKRGWKKMEESRWMARGGKIRENRRRGLGLGIHQ
jgi:hypothetical protein